MNTPQHKHDCPFCHFLGTHGDTDLYVCSQGNSPGYPTVLARKSSDDADYVSNPPGLIIHNLPDLIEARRRAIAEGYLLHAGTDNLGRPRYRATPKLNQPQKQPAK